MKRLQEMLKQAGLVALLFASACAANGTDRPPCTPAVPVPSARALESVRPPEPSAEPASSAAPHDLPPALVAPSPHEVVGPRMASLQDPIAKATEAVRLARKTVSVEGEDATSAFATITWAAADGTALKVRTVWNGGCCYSPEIHDYLLAGGQLLKEVFFVAPRSDQAALMRGEEPRHPIVLEELFFENGRMVLWGVEQGRLQVEPAQEPDRWKRREERSLEGVSPHASTGQ